MNLLSKNLATLIIVISFVAMINAQTPRDYTINKTELVDEFPILPECDFGARIDSLFIVLQSNPESKGHIIFYRGSEGLPLHHSDSFLKIQERRIKYYVEARGFDAKRLIVTDGGFVKGDSFINRLWVVPKNGESPKHLERVSKPEFPTDKAYLADNRSLQIYKSSIEYINEISESDTDLIYYEYTEVIDESEKDLESEIEDYYWVSHFFVERLEKDKKSSGIIFFYADLEEYNLGMAEEIIRKQLKKYSKENKADLSRFRLVYGGYRDYPQAEFWIVPDKTSDPTPSPEIKNKKEN